MTRTKNSLRAGCRAACHMHFLGVLALCLSLCLAGPARSATVVYTMRAMADGTFAGVRFFGLPVTIQLVSRTEAVGSQPGPNGGFILTNKEGTATLSIPGFPTSRFVPGEVYVRYDTGNGLIGFGSSISPTYPLTLGCADFATVNYTADCTQGDFTPGNTNTYNGIATALADPANALYQSLSSQTTQLPTSLSRATLLTGIVHGCATVYGSDGQGDLYSCSADAPRGLVTDQGSLYIRQFWPISNGGTSYFYSTNTGSILSYMGYLTVELSDSDSEE
jgi:hypothetical protein